MRVYRRYKNNIVREFTDETGDPCLELSTREGSTFSISKSDYDRVKRFSWNTTISSHGKKYVIGYRKKGKHFIHLHRYILQEKDETVIIDHKNSNGLDNRQANLRKATSQENSFNRVTSSRSSTGIKGVFYDKERNKYVARIQVDGVYKNLGRFETADQAAIAYEDAARQHYKDFARSDRKE